MALKNVTVTLEEEVAQWARIRAAKDNMSVSKLLGQLLKEMMDRDSRYQKAMKEYLATPSKKISKSGKYPSREALYDRGRIR